MEKISITTTTETNGREEISSPSEELDSKQRLPLWYLLGLSGLVLVSLVLNFYRLGQDGYGNLYYAAAVKSMLMNWHNFFFVSYDPSGFISVDKPPLAFWLQVGSARIFGLSPWSVMLPPVLAGVLSVPLLAHLVRRTYGPVAGLIAAAALTVMPINVVTDRNLTMDCVLIFVLLCASWTMLLAAETGRLRWLLCGFVLVGLGFNMKTLDAYIVLPAFILLYWFSAPATKRERLWHLTLAMLVLLLVSFCWIVVVDLIPATQRPYVGSSGSNSEFQLALLYNGGSRLIGSLSDISLLPSAAAIKLQNQVPAFAQESFFLGDPGLLRLVTLPLGAQIGWLIPLALLGLVGVKWDKPSFWPLNKQQQGLALWGLWFVAQFIVFSTASFMHQYYTSQMGPVIAALLAIGVVTTWQQTGRRRWLFPGALVITALVQLGFLSGYLADWEHWLIPVVVIGTIAGLLLLRPFQPGKRVLLAIALCAMLVGPTVWTILPLLDHRNEPFPYAGPAVNISPLEASVMQTDQAEFPDATLISYLQQHQGNARYLTVTSTSYISAPMILATGKPVMTLYGYQGQDHVLSIPQLQQLIRAGTVRYFVFTQTLQEAQLSPGVEAYQVNLKALLTSIDPSNQTDPTDTWVRLHCAAVPVSAWHTSRAATRLDLYDCG